MKQTTTIHRNQSLVEGDKGQSIFQKRVKAGGLTAVVMDDTYDQPAQSNRTSSRSEFQKRKWGLAQNSRVVRDIDMSGGKF